MIEHPEMVCENIFCINHASNDVGMISEWNKTKCSLFEIDPYEKKNPEGIRVDTCKARLKYKQMGWI